MFQRPLQQRISTRSQLAAQQQQQQTKSHNENAGRTAAGAAKSVLSAAGKEEVGRVTRKRRALGDVSNVNNNVQPSNGVNAVKKAVVKEDKKPLATKQVQQQQPKDDQPLAKTRPVRSAAVAAARKLSGIDVRPDPVLQQLAKKDEGARKRQKTVEKPVIVKDWDDLDADDKLDPLMVSEYVVEIFEYMRELEKTTMPDPDYMSKQRGLQWRMRSILVDWLVEVHLKFKLLPETLFLTINLLDRFMSLRKVNLNKFQLVGITAMFIAAKYEEVYAPSISQFVYIVDGGFTHDEIIRAERYMLQVLGFHLQFPNPLNFLRRCSKADGYDIQTRTLAKYFMEVSTLDQAFLPFPPSMIAASAMFISRTIMSRSDDVWTPNMRYYSGYKEEELSACIAEMLVFVASDKTHKYHSVYNKYSSTKTYGASLFAKKWVNDAKKQASWGVQMLDDLVSPLTGGKVGARNSSNSATKEQQKANASPVYDENCVFGSDDVDQENYSDDE